jgi:AhpD family alkylhydroperoxidase
MTLSARVPLINRTTHPECADLIEAVKAQRGGTFLNLYGALGNSPQVCSGWLLLFTAIRQKTKLSPKLRELIMLRVAVLNRAPYEFDSHRPHALAAGVTQAQLDALQSQALNASLFSPLEMAVLAYADAMTRDIQVTEQVFAPIRAAFDDQVVLELTVTVAGYNMVSRVLEALKVPHDI